MPDYRTPLPALLAASLESGLNAVLALDAGTPARMMRLQGRLVRLVLEGLGIELYFSFDGDRIKVSAEAPAPDEGSSTCEPDATVSGTPAALFSMAVADFGEGWGAPGSRVSITGEANLARDLERLFSRLEPDFEASLSRLFGDVLGHQFAAALREGARRARETASEARDVIGEVLREGAGGGRSGPLVGRDEMRRFADGVDELRDAAARIEARLRRLEDRTGGSGTGRKGS